MHITRVCILGVQELPWGRAHIHPSPSTSHPRSKKLPLVRSMHAARASLPRRYLFSAICGYARGQRDAAVVASSASKIGQARQWSNAPASLAVAAATGLQQSIPCREHNGRLARVLRQLSAGARGQSDTSTPSVSPASGDECYAKALRALQVAKEVQADKEEMLAAEQYESMQRAYERQGKRSKMNLAVTASRYAAGVSTPREAARAQVLEKDNEREGSGVQSRAAGVAVVKTIVKQARREREVHINKFEGGRKGDGLVAPEEIDWEGEARGWLERAAFEHGHPRALVRLGNDALEEAKRQHQSPNAEADQSSDSRLPQDLRNLSAIERAVRLYQKATEWNGSAEAYFNLGHLLWTGFPEESANDERDSLGMQDDVRPLLSLEAAGLPGDVDLVVADNALEMDRYKALQYFLKAVAMGDADAMYFVGVHFLSFEGDLADVAELRKRGERLIRSAAAARKEDGGHGGALYYLALLCRGGDPGLGIEPCSDADFASLLGRAAEAGDADALNLRAHCLYHGQEGYARDYAAALDGFLQAAKAGSADAAISAGAMYWRGGFDGASIRRDQRRAFELYQEAAEMGSTEGWRNLVSCYALGEGVPRCEKTARYIAETMLKGE